MSPATNYWQRWHQSLCESDFALQSSQHQLTLFCATSITNELFQASARLFDELWDGYTPIRQLGVHTSRIMHITEARQRDLFAMDSYEKYERLDGAIDEIRNRFGEEAIFRASYIGAGIAPINGGVSKEKKKAIGEEVFYE